MKNNTPKNINLAINPPAFNSLPKKEEYLYLSVGTFPNKSTLNKYWIIMFNDKKVIIIEEINKKYLRNLMLLLKKKEIAKANKINLK